MESKSSQPPLKGFGAGKVILLGEHSVVYGYPALAGPISHGVVAHGEPARTCHVDSPAALTPEQRKVLLTAFTRAAETCGKPQVNVRLEADLPLSMGLGSSAALSVACAKVLLQAGGRAQTPVAVARVAWEMEKVFHGTPSGVDHTASAVGQLILYRRKPGAEHGRAQVVKSPKPVRVLVALAGERSPTKTTVAGLRERQARWSQRYTRLFREIGKLAAEGAKAVEAGDLEGLGDAMNCNHGLLAALGLSSGSLDDMVHRLRAAGALGAKLTGAGGNGGAVVGLFHDPEPMVSEFLRLGIRCFSSQLAGPDMGTQEQAA
jgi:mevalonate kinase